MRSSRSIWLTRWLRRALLWSLLALLVTLVIRAIYQAIATEIDQRAAFPAPGEMGDVGEHRLHLNCVGQGGPTVVLDAGWGYTSVEWSAWVQPEVAEHTRVCAYDRAGMGWSEPEPGPPNATQTADELHAKQRVSQIACGYEEKNDSNTLRQDPLFKLSCGSLPESGEDLASRPSVGWRMRPPDARATR